MPESAEIATDSRRLNANDRVMLAVDQALRQIGYPGFQTQAFVCLDGRADERELRAALARLSEIHPVTVARLVAKRDGPHWQFREGARLGLDVIELASESDQAVHNEAGRLLGIAHDPAAEDPLRFHLLRRADGRDVAAAPVQPCADGQQRDAPSPGRTGARPRHKPRANDAFGLRRGLEA
jgi:hypothetical protein